jgi:ABC-type branched-subunit amino acid transport system ATPase component
MERQLALCPVLAQRRNQRADTLSGGGHSLRLANRVHVLENSRVVRSGTLAELRRQDKAIQQACLGL